MGATKKPTHKRIAKNRIATTPAPTNKPTPKPTPRPARKAKSTDKPTPKPTPKPMPAPTRLWWDHAEKKKAEKSWWTEDPDHGPVEKAMWIVGTVFLAYSALHYIFPRVVPVILGAELTD